MRLFIAINLPESARQRIHAIAKQLRTIGLPVRWVEPAAYHVTLEFLGEVSAERAPEVEAAIACAADGTPVFSIELGQIDVVPTPRRPRVLWIQVDGGPALEQIHARLARALSESGFALEDRDFRPHVTLGRVRRGGRPADFARLSELTADLDFASTSPVYSVDLMRSDRSAQGARYSVISSGELDRPG